MNLSDFLLDVGASYDRHASLSSHAQLLLRDADNLLAEHAPAGLTVIGSGGQGYGTFTPWIGFLDPDETSSPQRGIYVVYIFRQDLTGVVLTLMQGITELTESLGVAAARMQLGKDAAAIRGVMEEQLQGMDFELDLGATGSRQRSYRAGNIASLEYFFDAMPTEEVLRRDLARFMTLYQDAVHAKRRLLQEAPGKIASSSALLGENSELLRNFKPKDDSDYVARLTGGTIRKSRRHETLIGDYGRWISAQGYSPSTSVHPRDMTLSNKGSEWLVEAKVVYQGDATSAVRAAVGQLLTYRHFLYEPGHSPELLALFTEGIGDAYVAFLDALGVASVWRSEGIWCGSQVAVAKQLAQSI